MIKMNLVHYSSYALQNLFVVMSVLSESMRKIRSSYKSKIKKNNKPLIAFRHGLPAVKYVSISG